MSSSVLPAPLVEAVLFLFAFLELSDDDVVDPDSAVTAMENATADLLRLSPQERQGLVEHAKQLADEQWHNPRLAEFLRTFGESSGLVDQD